MRLPPLPPIGALILLCAGVAVEAQTAGTLEAAVGLYAAAAYDDALAMLDRLPAAGLDAAARVSVARPLDCGRPDADRVAVVGLLR